MVLNKNNSHHYKWGDNCDSWVFVDKENLVVKMESMPSGTKESIHFHSKAGQFFFVLSGNASFYIEDIQKIVKEQEGIFVAPNVPHYIANENDIKLDFLVISQPSTNGDRKDIKK